MLLAIVDTHFPWLLSGFRYWENLEFHKIDNSIQFFSVHKMNDPFPAKVQSLSSVKDYPITDIYCVFLNHTLGLLDCPFEIPGKQNYGLSEFIRDKNIRIHTTIGPGGGYEEVSHPDQALQGLKFLRDNPNLKNVFTNLSDVQRIIPEKSHRVAGIVNTDFYGYIPRAKNYKLQLLFAANPPRARSQKGLGYLLEAFNSLDPSKYHMHIVGDWKPELRKIKHSNYTNYGTLPPNKLMKVFYKCHVFVNPAYKENVSTYNRFLSSYGRFIPINNRFIPSDKGHISVDSFPTVAAAEAASTGCCLISTNSRSDHSVFEPGRDYLEVREKSSEDLLKAIEYLYQNQEEMLSMAHKGRGKILGFFDAKKNVAFKHNVISSEKR